MTIIPTLKINGGQYLVAGIKCLFRIVKDIEMKQSLQVTVSFAAVVASIVPLCLAAESLISSDLLDRLDEIEVESVETYIGIALDTQPDLGVQTWYSSGSDANGEIRLLRSFEFETRQCREIQIVIKKDNYTDHRTFSFCIDDDLQWWPLTYKKKN